MGHAIINPELNNMEMVLVHGLTFQPSLMLETTQSPSQLHPATCFSTSTFSKHPGLALPVDRLGYNIVHISITTCYTSAALISSSCLPSCIGWALWRRSPTSPRSVFPIGLIFVPTLLLLRASRPLREPSLARRLPIARGSS